MNTESLNGLIEWVGAHPIAAGLVAFLVAFGDSLLVVGIVVPSLPILMGLGALIGLGMIDGTYAVVSAGLGAFCGDLVSYGLGRWQGQNLMRRWPFSKYPGLYERAERQFNRHDLKAILIARFVGAIRPFIPAIAGMVHMPMRRYLPVSLAVSLAWAFAFIAPGWLFGASMDVFAAIAGRLAVVVLIIVLMFALVWWLVWVLYRLFAPRTTVLLERTLRWAHAHPKLGYLAENLLEPRRKYSPSLLMLAILSVLGIVALFGVALLGAGGEMASIDGSVMRSMYYIHSPLVDGWMVYLASAGDWPVLLPVVLLAFAWLLWRKRYLSARFWAFAVTVGLALVLLVGWLTDWVRVNTSDAEVVGLFATPQVAMMGIVFGFMAILVARELPGRRRLWPYVVAVIATWLLAFARLYFGMDAFSNILVGMLLALVWSTLVGIAYRRRVLRSFWANALAVPFFVLFAVLVVWHGHSIQTDKFTAHHPAEHVIEVSQHDWWNNHWGDLPSVRNGLETSRAWPINMQHAGSLADLTQRLQQHGWRSEDNMGMKEMLMMLNLSNEAEDLPVLPASHLGYPVEAVFTKPLNHQAGMEQRDVLHVWPTDHVVVLPDGSKQPVWQATIGTVTHRERFNLYRYWSMGGDFESARQRLMHDLSGWPKRDIQVRKKSGVVLFHAP